MNRDGTMDKFNAEVAEAIGAGRRARGPVLLTPKAFLDLATDEVRRALRYDRPLSVVMATISGIKELRRGELTARAEDRFHMVARHIISALRGIDRTGRLGRGEIGVLMPETSLTNATSAAERLRRHIAGMAVDDGGGPLTISLGVAAMSPRLRNPKTLLMSAVFELRRAQSQGGNRVAVAPVDTAYVSIPRSGQIH